MSFNPPPLPPTQPPWPQFQVWWQQVVESLKGELGALETAEEALAAAVAAQAAADTAQTAAATAQTSADTVKRDDKITASSIIPADVLDATDAGSSASITVAAHTRLYGDGSTLNVSGHTFTGLAYSTDYGIYYDDTTTSDTTPTYQTTTNLTRALNNYVAGRHLVGIISTPAAGGSDTSGGVQPPATGGTPQGQFSTL